MKLKKLLLCTSMGFSMFGAVAQSLPTIPGLVMHLDASQITAVDGAAITTWNDVSGANNHATSVGATGTPTYVASSSAFNNKPTLSFDGVDDWMDLPDVVDSGNFTFFVMVKISTNVGDSYVISGYDATDAFAGFDGKNRFRIANYNNNSQFASRMGNSPDKNILAYDANPHVFVNNSNGFVWADNLQVISANNGIAPSKPNIRMGAIQVAPEAPKGFLIGEVAEFILYNTSLSDTQVESVIAYLQSKYIPTAGVDDLAQRVNLKIYPNPTSSNITIKADNNFITGAALNIYDITGRLMINKTLTNSNNVLDFSNLPSGSYLMKITNNGETLVKQISKR